MTNSTTLKLPPRRPPPGPPPPPSPRQRARINVGKPAGNRGHRIVLYGPGGIGKTTLCSFLPGPVFIDLEDSLSKLKLDVPIITGINAFADMREALAGDGWDAFKSIIIDTGTKAEELCIADTLTTVKTEGGTFPTSIEGYGWGKGYTHVFERFLPLIGDLDAHTMAGRNVVIVCHDCTSKVPNPLGEDWIRYEPRLQSPASGKASIRLRVREWADHVLCMTYDVAVNRDGKGIGSGTRTIYTAELPWFMAKSRTTSDCFPINDNAGEFWQNIIT